MDSLENMNHAISFIGYWIFDSNYGKSLVLKIESLDMNCAPSVGEEQSAKFELIFTEIRNIFSASQLKKG